MSGTEYVKFTATQGGPFDSTQNIIDFHVPADVYNLRDSFIQIYTEAEGTDTDDLGVQGIYPINLVMANDAAASGQAHFLNAVMVKNCSISSAVRGQLENIRRVDQLRQALNTVAKSERENKSVAYMSANSMVDAYGNKKLGMFQILNKEGNEISKNVQTPIMIRLGDLMDFCNATVYDGNKLGALHIRLEMNLDGIIKGECSYDANYFAGASTSECFATITATSDNQVVDSITTLNEASSVAPGTARQDGQQFRGIRSIDESPWFVGQRITLTSSDGDLNETEKVVQITEITFNDAAGTVTLNFTPPLGTLPTTGDKCDNIIIDNSSDNGAVQPAAVNVRYQNAEVVMRRYTSLPPSDGGMLVYSTFSTEEDVGPTGVEEFQRQYVVEPDADAVLVLMPKPANDLVSQNADFNSYRLRLNQVDMTDRDVEINTPLYYDKTSSLLDSMGMSLGALAFNQGAATKDNLNYNAAFPAATEVQFFGAPMPQMNSNKLLQVNINAPGGDVPRVTLFKHLPRKIVY